MTDTHWDIAKTIVSARRAATTYLRETITDTDQSPRDRVRAAEAWLEAGGLLTRDDDTERFHADAD